jgi:putative transposase
VYLDDILIFSDTPEAHLRHVGEILARLRNFKLFASLKKLAFLAQQIEFLGFILSIDRMSIDLRYVDAIRQWPRF